MSKIKHLLRKLHIGNAHQNSRPSRRRNPSNNPSTESSAPPSSSSSVSSPPSDSSDRTVRELPPGNVRVRNPRNFNFLEEEFQVQLAMALSASDPRKDDEADQIKAAKQLSLGCSPSVADNEAISEFLSLKYWNYNVVQYEEKVVDGFYDVHAVTSNLIAQGDMPLLVDLQAMSILENGRHEVVLVNRSIDIQLQQLEDRVHTTSVECRVMGHELFLNSLIQRIAHLVVDRLGGPVVDAKEIMKRWRIRSNQLKSSLNTIVLPLGSLDVGLSRHRALLFKVLADRVNLPCMLVKGSLYTGTDEGAVNLIKFDDGSEYILDLMAAPGTLIPVEVPSNLLLDTMLEGRVLSESIAAVHNLSLVFDEMVGLDGSIPDGPEVCGSNLKEKALARTPGKQENEIAVADDLNQRYQYELEKPVNSEFYGSGSLVEEASLRQENKVKDVSKYVISAAKNPEFAQKLHAVLLESGASPPADLFMDMHTVSVGENALSNQILPLGQQFFDSRFSGPENCRPDELSLHSFSVVQTLYNNEIKYSVENSLALQLQCDTNLVNASPYSEPKDDDVNHVAVEANKIVIRDGVTAKLSGGMPDHDGHIFQDYRGGVINQTEVGDLSSRKLMEMAKSGCLISGCGDGDNFTHVSGEKVCPMLGEFAEWEIPWEDLQIGERIGIGSFGEVFHADWNGTEVAVKKFLVQDLTGDVLVQFKCEAEMMIRLRHPNVVLFMGAVSCPPNLSILTEFLPRGSLYKLLHRSGTQIDEKTRMKMALDVARGMNYLHTSHPTVVHRDLKSPNLLVDKNWVVKVCDFGLSRVKHHTFLSSNSTAGTPEWMAPEVLRNEPSDEKCDVYSFGVILWELVTLCVPWTGWNPMQVVGAVGFQSRRLEIPKEVDPVVAQIIRDCWENDPRLRPSFAQLISRLKGLQCLVVQRD